MKKTIPIFALIITISLFNCEDDPEPCISSADFIYEIKNDYIDNFPKDGSDDCAQYGNTDRAFNVKGTIIEVDDKNIHVIYTNDGLKKCNKHELVGVYYARSSNYGRTWKIKIVSPISDVIDRYDFEPKMFYDFYDDKFLICFEVENMETDEYFLRIVEIDTKNNTWNTTDFEHKESISEDTIVIHKNKIYYIGKDNDISYLNILNKQSDTWLKESNELFSSIFNVDLEISDNGIFYIFSSSIIDKNRILFFYISHDEGKTWSEKIQYDKIPHTTTQREYFATDGDNICIARIIDENLFIYFSPDGGKTWNKYDTKYKITKLDSYTNRVLKIDGNKIYFVSSGSAKVIYSHDAGKTWNAISNLDCNNEYDRRIYGVNLDIFDDTLYFSYYTRRSLTMKMAELKIK